MIDGAAQLYGTMFAFHQTGFWNEARGTNVLDGGAHFYDVYETADAHYVALGAVEPQFYAMLLQAIGLNATELPDQWDQSQWDAMKERFATIFRNKTRADWCDIFAGFDACFAPVLSFTEAMENADNQERGLFMTVDGVQHPAPAPRFSRTPAHIAHGARPLGTDTVSVLQANGYSDAEIDRLLSNGIAASAQ
jgi:alpha-methylacyl-CoA racemase